MYRILGIKPGENLDAIKAAYRRLAKRLHPDLARSAESGRDFSRVNEAYRGLLEHRRKQSIIAAPLRKPFGEAVRSARVFRPVNIFSAGELVLKGENPLTRVLSAQNLGLSGKTAAYVFLRKALEDADERVVKASVRAIAQLRIMQSGDDLAALFNRAGPDVKLEILLAVQRIGRPALFSTVIRAARRDGNERIRGKAEVLHQNLENEAISGTR